MPQEPLKPFRWNVDKNNQLQQEREINFETIVAAVTGGRLLDTIEHPNQEKYPNQRIFIVEIDHYVYLVPFVEDDTEFFLKTIIPSRKMTKQYLGE
ncbi:toxin [Pseudanabaena mucicola]|uniref:toxin n=1 Tax=Pseudanabaena mucicola TaxID=71190 RepID=UPI002576AC9B|nr:toxin [Pseudanabaena mucicola]